MCILGARQIGKTTTTIEFAKKHYKNYVLFDFIRSKEDCRVFDQAETVEDILQGIWIKAGVTLQPGKTLVVLDEIQECPQARTIIKYLVEEGNYDYIETGSLPGIKINSIRFLPVGYEQIVHMYPHV